MEESRREFERYQQREEKKKRLSQTSFNYDDNNDIKNNKINKNINGSNEKNNYYDNDNNINIDNNYNSTSNQKNNLDVTYDKKGSTSHSDSNYSFNLHNENDKNKEQVQSAKQKFYEKTENSNLNLNFDNDDRHSRIDGPSSRIKSSSSSGNGDESDDHFPHISNFPQIGRPVPDTWNDYKNNILTKLRRKSETSLLYQKEAKTVNLNSFEHPFDGRGALNYLGTKGNTVKYVNPHSTGT